MGDERPPKPLPRAAIVVQARGTKAMAVELDQLAEDSPLRLIREPLNPYDANAVRIEAQAFARHSPWTLVAYVPREIAVRLALNIDGGEKWCARVYELLLRDGHYQGMRVQLYPEGLERLPDQLKRDHEHDRRKQRQRQDWGSYAPDYYGYGY